MAWVFLLTYFDSSENPTNKAIHPEIFFNKSSSVP